ncbi:MAG: hypothetical protein JJD92_12650 [Frankiaceae bacterium]|nr:hypothetical protein [Frankiaceae bacterium]
MRTGAAVVATCLVATLCYAGSVTVPALLTYVLPGAIAAALLVIRLISRRRPVRAALLGPALALAVAELANVIGGESSGPIARSTFLAGCGISLALCLADRLGLVFLVPVAGIVIGALALGSAGEVRFVAVAAAIGCVLSSSAVERHRRRWFTPPPRRWVPVVIALLCAAVATGLALLQNVIDDRPPVLIAAGQIDSRIQPPQVLTRYSPTPSPSPSPTPSPMPTTVASSSSSPKPPLVRPVVPPVVGVPSHRTPPPKTARPHPSLKPTTKAQSKPKVKARTAPQPPVHRWWLLILLVLVAALVLPVLLRLLVVKWRWARLRRRLQRGDPPQRMAGAWAWARHRLAAAGLPLPVHAGPDVLAADAAATWLPEPVLGSVQALALHTVRGLFATAADPTAEEGNRHWALAREVSRVAFGRLPARRRLQAAFRPPRPTNA